MGVLIVVAVVIVCILALSFYTYFIAFYSSKKNRGKILDNPPQYENITKRSVDIIKIYNDMASLVSEQIYIKSYDGITLAGKYHHIKDGAPLQIQFHGYKGSALRDFCGGNHLARELGFNTLYIDQRAHGKSGGNTITFGIKERYDCLAWVNYAKERFGSDTKIILAGISMGAATVLMASEFNLPDNVVGIIADCPYSSPKDIILKVCKEDIKIAPAIAYPFIYLGALIFGRFNLCATTAAKSVEYSDIPILIIHGEDDKFVPKEMSDEIKSANPDIVRETFPYAGHGYSYIVDAPRYKQIVEKFCLECLNKKP